MYLLNILCDCLVGRADCRALTLVMRIGALETGNAKLVKVVFFKALISVACGLAKVLQRNRTRRVCVHICRERAME